MRPIVVRPPPEASARDRGFGIVIAGEVLQHRQRDGAEPALAMPGAPDYIQYDVPEIAADKVIYGGGLGPMLR